MHENQIICITMDLNFTLEVALKPAGVSKKSETKEWNRFEVVHTF